MKDRLSLLCALLLMGSVCSKTGSSEDDAVTTSSSTGALDTTFDTDGKVITNIGTTHDQAYAVVIQSDGKIVVAGKAGTGTDDVALARYNTTGSLDTFFNATGKVTTAIGSADEVAFGLALQSDSKIVVAGQTHNGSNLDFCILRYDTSGTLDTGYAGDGSFTATFATGDERAYAVRVQPDGRVVAAGASYNGTNDDFALLRTLSTGVLDTTFDTDGKLTTAVGSAADVANALAIQSDAKILAAGVSHNGTNNDFAVTRYTSTGTLDTTFDTDGMLTTAVLSADDTATAVVVQSDGKIVVVGYAHNGTNNDIALVRYSSLGVLDATFDGDGKVTTNFGSEDYAYAVALQSDGKILVAGKTGSTSDFAVLRYNTDGSLDATFDGDGGLTTDLQGFADEARAVAVQSDGKIVVAGFGSNGTYNDFGVVRYK